jgi:hypothetical protein
MYIYIYMCVCVCVCVYIYIYIYIYGSVITRPRRICGFSDTQNNTKKVIAFYKTSFIKVDMITDFYKQ